MDNCVYVPENADGFITTTPKGESKFALRVRLHKHAKVSEDKNIPARGNRMQKHCVPYLIDKHLISLIHRVCINQKDKHPNRKKKKKTEEKA